MAIKGIGQITICDLNDITTSSTAPISPTTGQLWLDTSVAPNILKKWNGSTWEQTGASSLAQLDPSAASKVTSNTSDIQVTADAIGLNLTTQTLGDAGLNKRLTAAESSITANANAISLKVSQSDIDTSIGAIKVGGRNLVLNSGNFLNTNNWEIESPDWAISVTNSILKLTKLTTNTFKWAGPVLSQALKPNTKYVMTMRIRTSLDVANRPVRLCVAGSKSSYSGNLGVITATANTWTEFTYTFTTAAATSWNKVFISGTEFNTTNETIEFEWLKIEEGNKSTTWTPAVEYVDNRFSSVEAKITDSAFTVQIQKNSSTVYKVRYIRDWVGAYVSGTSYTPGWQEIQVFNSKGVNVALNKTVTGAAGLTSGSLAVNGTWEEGAYYGSYSTPQYIIVDLGSVMTDIDEIRVWHTTINQTNPTVFNGTKTEISSDGINWITLFDSSVSGTYLEYYNGHQIKVNSQFVHTTKGSFTDEGLTIYNGAITVQNTSGVNVMYVDTDGLLTTNSLKVVGTGNNTVIFSGNGEKNIKLISDDGNNVFQYFKTGESVGRIGTYANRQNGEIFLEAGKYTGDVNTRGTIIIRGSNSTPTQNALCDVEIHGDLRLGSGCTISCGALNTTLTSNIEQFNMVSGTNYYMQISPTTASGIPYAFGVTVWQSDMMLKTNFGYSTEVALDKIMSIEHAFFDWKDGIRDHVDCGYVAQQLQLVEERWVMTIPQEDGSDLVQPYEPGLIPYITKAIQEQQVYIKILEERIKVLEGATA